MRNGRVIGKGMFALTALVIGFSFSQVASAAERSRSRDYIAELVAEQRAQIVHALVSTEKPKPRNTPPDYKPKRVEQQADVSEARLEAKELRTEFREGVILKSIRKDGRMAPRERERIIEETRRAQEDARKELKDGREEAKKKARELAADAKNRKRD